MIVSNDLSSSKDENVCNSFNSGQLDCLSNILNNLKMFCLSNGCTDSVELFERKGKIYLRWSSNEYIVNIFGALIGGKGIKISDRVKISNLIVGTIRSLVSQVPFKIKYIKFYVSKNNFTSGEYWESQEEKGSYDIELR